MTREDFMEFFRDDEKLNELTVEDRIEVFLTILPGSSDITITLLNDLLRDYDVDGIYVVNAKYAHKFRDEI